MSADVVENMHGRKKKKKKKERKKERKKEWMKTLASEVAAAESERKEIEM